MRYTSRPVTRALFPSVSVIVGAALWAQTRDASANPLDMYGFGSRSTALAGAVSADVGDVSSNYYNPAGLARLRGVRGELGYFYAQPWLATDGRDNDVDASRGLTGGLGVPGRLFGVPFAFGLGLHLPDDRVSLIRAIPQAQPRWELYDVRLQRIFIAANVAIAPVRWLRLGGGVAFMASTRADIAIDGTISVTNAGETSLMHTVDADLVTVRYAQLGAQLDLSPDLTLSFAWRDQFTLDLKLDALIAGRVVAGPVTDPRSIVIPGSYTLVSRTLTAFQPRQWVAGAVLRASPRCKLMVDFTFVQWSAYENPTAALQVGLDLRVPPGIPGLRQPTVPTPSAREPARFRDTVVARVGAEYLVPLGRHEIALRGGYHFDPTPVPEQTGATNFIDASRHVFALGAGITLRRLGAVLPGTLGVDVHAALQWLPERATVKTSPVDPVGDYRAGGVVFNAGVTTSVGFE